MKAVINTEKHPIKLWLDDIEAGALAQARNLANLPFAFRHVAIMPDAHQGYGMPIGGVLATKGTIVPNAVGVDIGCGMCAVRTDKKAFFTDTYDLQKIVEIIQRTIPTGFNWNKTSQEDSMPMIARGPHPVIYEQWNRATLQLGSLGGGNHFIEIQRGSDGFIWLMIHSGSRNLGKQVADFYNKKAVELNERYFSSVPKEWQLAFFPQDSLEFGNYRSEMNYCVDFALANRQIMMARMKDAFLAVLPDTRFDEPINIAHNYAAMENHFGENVMVHRKGATSARLGQIGIIPGSQGTRSYIVRGLGNTESFQSCSHGAGRKMGRSAARKTLDLAKEQAAMAGIIHSMNSTEDLDEAPGAYKDIDTVMANQLDLVEIVTELVPLAVIKGGEKE